MSEDKRTVLELTVEELTEIVKTDKDELHETVKTGCRECLKEIGFNVDNPGEIIKNQIYLTKIRESSEKVTTAVKISTATAVVSLVIAGCVKLFKTIF